MDADVNRWLTQQERHNKGWLTPENCPPCNVFLNGQPVRGVLAVNRRRGKVEQTVYPVRANRKGEIITRMLYGAVRIELI